VGSEIIAGSVFSKTRRKAPAEEDPPSITDLTKIVSA